MIEHGLLVLLSKSTGVIYFFLIFLAVVIYVCLPRNKEPFDHAAQSIITDEDKPCQ